MDRRYLVVIIFITMVMAVCVIPEDIKELDDGSLSNHPPQIMSYSPQAHVVSVPLSDTNPQTELMFSLNAEDPDGDALNYRWEISDCNTDCKSTVSETGTNLSEYRFQAMLPERDLILGVEVSDNEKSIFLFWVIRIQRQGPL